MVNFCPECGKSVENETSKFCNECGAKLTIIAVEQKASNQVKIEKRNSATPMICSFFIPGLGQVYNGDNVKGTAIFLGTVIGAFIFIIPGLAVWIFGLYDAYTTANKMNNKEIPYKRINTDNMILFVIFAVIAIVIIICIVIFVAVVAVLTSFIHR
jgi:TM2 domain-containing membrane protein YozV